MSNLSQDDLLYGTARRFIPDSVYSIGESGEFNFQPSSSSSVMTMTNFTGEEPSDCPECEEALKNCLEDKQEIIDELIRANNKNDCLEDLLLPPDLTGSGSGAWQHFVPSLKPTYPNDPKCTAILGSSISADAISVNQVSGNVIIRFTRENDDPDCQASGAIGWIISPNRNGTPNFAPSWSGGRGDTTVVDKEYAPGTYYVYAYGFNLDNNVNSEQYQSKGNFVISTSGGVPNIEKTFEVTNTIVGGQEPCA
jgi:hypothetical protein